MFENNNHSGGSIRWGGGVGGSGLSGTGPPLPLCQTCTCLDLELIIKCIVPLGNSVHCRKKGQAIRVS